MLFFVNFVVNMLYLLTQRDTDVCRITQMTMNSIREADGYPHYAPIFDEYRPGIKRYLIR